MAKKEPPLPMKAHAQRMRVFNLEQKHAVAYPDEREKLAAEVEEAIHEYEALVPEIEAEAEKLRDEIMRELQTLKRKRDDLLLLLGRKEEDTFFRNAQGERWATNGPTPHFAKACELDLAELQHYEPNVWDQRTRNERAGKGYMTDEGVERVGTVAQHGYGATIQKFPKLGE
jgi:hypothetical protein